MPNNIKRFGSAGVRIDLIQKSAIVVPKLTFNWQVAQDPPDSDRQTSDVKFVYDGKFVNHPAFMGCWTTQRVVKTIEELKPDNRLHACEDKLNACEDKLNGSIETKIAKRKMRRYFDLVISVWTCPITRH